MQKPDPIYGDRFLVDLEVGLRDTNQSFRLSEHVYQKKGSAKLCLPQEIRWNNKATVYFIIPVKNQGKWVYHFINELTFASLVTGDTNFHVIVVDFKSEDINMTEAFQTPLLNERHTIVNLTGKFHKTLALNEGANKVPGKKDILLLFDLHIDVPVSILETVRKVSISRKYSTSNNLFYKMFREMRAPRVHYTIIKHAPYVTRVHYPDLLYGYFRERAR